MGKNEIIGTLEKLIASRATTCVQKNALRKAVSAVRRDQRPLAVRILVLTVNRNGIKIS